MFTFSFPEQKYITFIDRYCFQNLQQYHRPHKKLKVRSLLSDINLATNCSSQQLPTKVLTTSPAHVYFCKGTSVKTRRKKTIKSVLKELKHPIVNIKPQKVQNSKDANSKDEPSESNNELQQNFCPRQCLCPSIDGAAFARYRYVNGFGFV